MILYFIIAHCRFTANFSSKLKCQLQVIFDKDSFPLNVSPFQVSLLQNSTNCLLANGCLLLSLLFLHKNFPSLLASVCFVERYFSFVEQIVLVAFPDYSLVATKFPILFFICLEVFAFEYFQYHLIFDISE